MELIKDVIANVIQDLTRKQDAISNTPQALLKKVLTKKEQGHIKFGYFKKGILGLYVDSSSWLYSLTLKKEELKQKLNSESCPVKDIHLRLGEV